MLVLHDEIFHHGGCTSMCDMVRKASVGEIMGETIFMKATWCHR